MFFTYVFYIIDVCNYLVVWWKYLNWQYAYQWNSWLIYFNDITLCRTFQRETKQFGLISNVLWTQNVLYLNSWVGSNDGSSVHIGKGVCFSNFIETFFPENTFVFNWHPVWSWWIHYLRSICTYEHPSSSQC